MWIVVVVLAIMFAVSLAAWMGITNRRLDILHDWQCAQDKLAQVHCDYLKVLGKTDDELIARIETLQQHVEELVRRQQQ